MSHVLDRIVIKGNVVVYSYFFNFEFYDSSTDLHRAIAKILIIVKHMLFLWGISKCLIFVEQCVTVMDLCVSNLRTVTLQMLHWTEPYPGIICFITRITKWWYIDNHLISMFQREFYGPLTRYVKLRVAHASEMPGTFPCHRGLAWCMPGSPTGSFLWS